MSRTRRPTKGDRALWHRVIRDVVPLRPDADQSLAKPQPATPTEAKKGGPRPPSQPARLAVHQDKPLTVPSGDPNVLHWRLRRRLNRGQNAVDARLDLHGMTQIEARAALAGAVHREARRGARVLLVITGKGMGSEGGVLRRRLPDWLSEPEIRSVVTAFTQAGPRQGGAGAFYLILRHRKPSPLGG